MNRADPILQPYFGYLGSKSSLADELIRRMPAEAFHSYCEVFAGGLGLFFHKPKAQYNILNDIDADIVDTHVTVAAMPEKVMDALSKLRPARTTFNRFRDLRGTTEWHNRDDAERAAAIIYLAKNSVNANFRSFSNSSKCRSTFNPKFDLRPYRAKFDRVTFENLHWAELLNRLVFKPREVTLFGYLDPPYVTSDSEKHYRYNFTAIDHVMLARTLAQVNQQNDGQRRNVKIMVSYDDDPNGLIRSLYRREHGWWIETIGVRYGSEHRANRCRNELLIVNYDPASIQCGNGMDGARLQTGGAA